MAKYDFRCPNERCADYRIIVELEGSMMTVLTPECGSCGHELVRVWSSPAISFRGKGFYSTDSRTKHVSASARTGGKGVKEE